MKLNEVMKITGLTKKAIRYYEDKGLVNPQFDSDNTFKNYSEDDISRLNQIAFLRNMDMPVSDIKLYLDNPEIKNEILRDYLEKIEENIKRYSDIKDSVTNILENNVDIKKLNRYMLDSQRYNKNFVLRRISLLFPDMFGKYIMIHFGTYMNEPLDSEKKQRAFNDMVEFLDNVEDVKFPPKIIKYYQDMDEVEFIDRMTMIDNATYKKIMNFDVNSSSDVEQFKGEVKEYTSIMKEFEKELKPIIDFKDYMENKLRETGYYEKFVVNLRIISSSYDEYIRKCEEINDVVGIG